MTPTPVPVTPDPPGRPHRPAPLLRTVLGQVLRRERAHQDRTLADVAGAANVSMPYLSEVERGRKEASSEVLSAICAALRIDLADVVAQAGRDLAAGSRLQARAARLQAVRTERAIGSRGSAISIAPRRPPAAGGSAPVRLAA